MAPIPKLCETWLTHYLVREAIADDRTALTQLKDEYANEPMSLDLRDYADDAGTPRVSGWYFVIEDVDTHDVVGVVSMHDHLLNGACVRKAERGKRLGTIACGILLERDFETHQGAVYAVDVTKAGQNLMYNLGFQRHDLTRAAWRAPAAYKPRGRQLVIDLLRMDRSGIPPVSRPGGLDSG